LNAVPAAGKKPTSLSYAGTVRCDSKDVGFREVWQVRCQAAQKKKRLVDKLEKRKKEKQFDLASLEREEMYVAATSILLGLNC
jgi:hypothetical protein